MNFFTMICPECSKKNSSSGELDRSGRRVHKLREKSCFHKKYYIFRYDITPQKKYGKHKSEAK